MADALRHIDARVRLACLVLYVLAVFNAGSWWALAACVVVAMAVGVAAGLGPRDVVRVLRPLAAVLVVTVAVQLLVDSASALVTSARMLVVLLCVMCASAAVARVSTATELTDALAWAVSPLTRAGVRTEGFLFALNVALTSVPTLADDLHQLRWAQEARLASFDGSVTERLRAWSRVFPPLVRGSLRRADTLADAALCRGLGSGATRVSRRVHMLGAADVLALLGFVALFVLCVVF